MITLQTKLCSMHKMIKLVSLFLCKSPINCRAVVHGNWIQYYFVYKRLTSLLSHRIECEICRCYVIIFFLSFSGSGRYAQFNIYFSRFMITRYRTDVLYSWKGLLGELSHTYESPNYNHIICAHSVQYIALWLCYIMFPKSIEID